MIGRVSLVALGALMQFQAAHAAGETPAVDLCSLILDRTTTYLRAGDVKRAKVNQPYLEKCGPIFKAAQAQQLDKMQAVVDKYGEKLGVAPDARHR